ncbi:MAG TPA: acyltransferase [Chryseobacterium sp.]|nr:acyltransferase [Chryseobacterium sp.]
MLRLISLFFTRVYNFFMRKIRYIFFKSFFGKFGAKSEIKSLYILENPENIFIDENVIIGKNAWLSANPLTGSKDCRLEIKNGADIGGNVHIYCTNSIIIEKKVLIAEKVFIADNQHSYSDITAPIMSQPIMQLSNVVLKEGCWIGENVCICGASVGKNSVIGANSVVNRDIPDFCVAVGAPAKIIKRYSFEKQAWLKTNAQGEFI